QDGGVDKVDAAFLRLRVTPWRVAKVRVAAVDDDVVLVGDEQQLLERVLGDLAGGDHQPERARGLKLLLELVERRRRARADVRVVAPDLMAAPAEALRHPGADPAEADHSQFHLDPYSDDLAAEAAERLEVALGLRTDQPPEAEVPTRDRDLRARVVHDLDEEPRRRSALLQL